MKVFRRIVIVICSILLIPLIIISIPEGKYFNKNIKDKVKSGKAKVIEVNKEWNLDGDKVIIQRIITTDENTYVRIRYIQKNKGWSFSFTSIQLYDSNGMKDSVSGESVGKLWGEDGFNEYSKISDSTKVITLKLEMYDRKLEMEIPCTGGGNI